MTMTKDAGYNNNSIISYILQFHKNIWQRPSYTISQPKSRSGQVIQFPSHNLAAAKLYDFLAKISQRPSYTISQPKSLSGQAIQFPAKILQRPRYSEVELAAAAEFFFMYDHQPSSTFERLPPNRDTAAHRVVIFNVLKTGMRMGSVAIYNFCEDHSACKKMLDKIRC